MVIYLSWFFSALAVFEIKPSLSKRWTKTVFGIKANLIERSAETGAELSRQINKRRVMDGRRAGFDGQILI